MSQTSCRALIALWTISNSRCSCITQNILVARRTRRNSQTHSAGAKQSASAYFAKSAWDKNYLREIILLVSSMRHAFFFARRIRRITQKRTRLACAYHPDGSAGAKQSASAYFAKSARDKKFLARKFDLFVCVRRKIRSEKKIHEVDMEENRNIYYICRI